MSGRGLFATGTGTGRSDLRGLFVTGTGTGVGKSVLAASLLATLAAAGLPVRAHKPVLTGADDPPGGTWPADDELLGLAAGATPGEVAPLRYGPPVSPHLAALLAGERIDLDALIAGVQAGAEDSARQEIVIVEGVGGLLVPLSETFSVRDLARALDLPVLVAAPPGLGTINHTLLTLEAARSTGLDVRAVVLTPWPGEPSRDEPSRMERSNRETIARIGEIEVATLPRVRAPQRELLAAAGERLPWREWLQARSS